jgi:hypothetical protein
MTTSKRAYQVSIGRREGFRKCDKGSARLAGGRNDIFSVGRSDNHLDAASSMGGHRRLVAPVCNGFRAELSLGTCATLPNRGISEGAMASKASKITVAILTCASLSLPPTSAQAGASTGTWRYWNPGWGYGSYGGYPAYGGYYGGGYPAYYGAYPGYYGYPGYYYHRRRSSAGAALAVGLIGGMALGAILARSSARGYSRCYVVPRRVATASGGTYIRRIRSCR